MAADRVGQNDGTDLSRFWVKGHGKQVNFREHNADRLSILNCLCDVLFRRYVVSSAEVAKSGQKFDVFCAPNLGKGPPKFVGAFVNRRHFRPILAKFG